MTVTEQVVDAELVDGEQQPSQELVPHQSGTLFRSDEPAEVIERAAKVADVLKGVLKQQRLTSSIQGREHVLVEGWTTCGAMLGVVPVVTWTRKLENGWEARVEARTLDGRTIGAAEASCTRDESKWAKRDDYALRSMAQTRATSKALRGPLGFIVTLAGFDATPSDEMPADAPARADTAHPQGPSASEELRGLIGPALMKILGGDHDRAKDAYKKVTVDLGVNYMPQAAAQALVTVAGSLDEPPWMADLPEPE